MPASVATTSNRKPADAWDRSKRYVATLAQAPKSGDKGRPLTDVDWNAAQMALLHTMMDFAQGMTVSGAMGENVGLVAESGSPNDFLLTGGGANLDASPFYLVGRYPAVLPWDGFVSWASFAYTSAIPWMHRRATGMTATDLTDDDAAYVIQALRGRNVYLATYNTITHAWVTSGPFVVFANTKGRLVFPTGTNLLAQHGPGSYYYVAPATPASGTRSDEILLDVYLDEIGPKAVVGDPIADSSLLVDLGSGDIETTRRLAIRQNVFYSHGGTDIALTLVPGSSDLYTYVDTSFKSHYVVKLTAATRRAGTDAIPATDMQDLRSCGGAGAQRSVERIAAAAFHGVIVFSGGPPVKNSGNAAQLDIPTRRVWHRGRELWLSASHWQAPTGGGAWASGTEYIARVEANRNIVVVPLGADPLDSATQTMLARFTPTSSSDIGTVIDEGKYAVDFFTKLHFDAAGRLRRPLKVRGKVGVEVYDDAASPTKKGAVGYDLVDPSWPSGAGVGGMSALAEQGVPASFGQRRPLGKMAGISVDDSYDGTVTGAGDPDVVNTGALYMLGQGGVIRARGASSPALAEFNILKTDKLVAPGIIFGRASATGNREEAIPFDMFVPASDGKLCMGSFVYHEHVRQISFDGTALFFNLEDYGHGLPDALHSTTLRLYHLSLPIPRGTKITSIEARFRNDLINGQLTAYARLFTQATLDDAPGTTLTPLASMITKVYTTSNTGADGAKWDATSNPTLFPLIAGRVSGLDYKSLVFGLHVAKDAPDTVLAGIVPTRVFFTGVRIIGETRAIGSPSVAYPAHVSAPLSDA